MRSSARSAVPGKTLKQAPSVAALVADITASATFGRISVLSPRAISAEILLDGPSTAVHSVTVDIPASPFPARSGQSASPRPNASSARPSSRNGRSPAAMTRNADTGSSPFGVVVETPPLATCEIPGPVRFFLVRPRNRLAHATVHVAFKDSCGLLISHVDTSVREKLAMEPEHVTCPLCLALLQRYGKIGARRTAKRTSSPKKLAQLGAMIGTRFPSQDHFPSQSAPHES